MSVPSETSGMASIVALTVVVVMVEEVDDESKSSASKVVLVFKVVEWMASGWAASEDKEDGMEALLRPLVASMLLWLASMLSLLILMELLF